MVTFASLNLLMLNIYTNITYSGAIAIRGGRFSEASVSILVGSVECNGSESGLLECAHVIGSDVAVTQCDPRESAAVACHGESKIKNIISVVKVTCCYLYNHILLKCLPFNHAFTITLCDIHNKP